MAVRVADGSGRSEALNFRGAGAAAAAGALCAVVAGAWLAAPAEDSTAADMVAA